MKKLGKLERLELVVEYWKAEALRERMRLLREARRCGEDGDWYSDHRASVEEGKVNAYNRVLEEMELARY